MKKETMNQEDKMHFKAKVAIFLLAVLITLAGFSLISAPAVDILKIGKEAGYEIIANVVAERGLPSSGS
ncbi:MAG: hypothetical protein AB1715_06235 [Acidobacteriota bacterium]